MPYSEPGLLTPNKRGHMRAINPLLPLDEIICLAMMVNVLALQDNRTSDDNTMLQLHAWQQSCVSRVVWEEADLTIVGEIVPLKLGPPMVRAQGKPPSSSPVGRKSRIWCPPKAASPPIKPQSWPHGSQPPPLVCQKKS